MNDVSDLNRQAMQLADQHARPPNARLETLAAA
jgi:hypothetical protein